MHFQRRERRISRIMIVEDEPLVAFDNESMLQDAGYEIVATVDGFAAAQAVIEAEALDLILTDIALAGEGDGLDVARAAGAKGVAVLLVTGGCTDEARSLAIGCLAKPYSEKVLLGALAAVDEHMQGRTVKKLPDQLTLYAETSPSP
jgi:DNA-binding response OmpR family regulator